MALSAGTHLGSYEILSALGVGGMGEVYRARDATLNRHVAIKVLLPAVVNDPERLLRFRREAQLLASLNHPNIAHIYGLEGQEGRDGQDGKPGPFLVMELVEGPTLAERLEEVSTLRAQGSGLTSRGSGLPLEDALPIAKQIAVALEAAHEQGIIHRDLKPANIKVRPDGTVKVLDFGLAKALEPPGSSPNASLSPTITTPAMTQAGMVLGTAAYMAPEQAKGRPADKRSDVWAFGCVFYEMLTGRRAFPGEDVSDTLATVLKSEPDWNALPATVPAGVRALIQGCLRKDRKERIGDISTALFMLGQPHAVTDAALAAGAPPPVWRRARLVAAGVVVGAGIAAAMLWTREPSTARPVMRFAVTLAQQQQLSLTRQAVTLSPDGTRMVYAASGGLFLRSMSDLEARAIPGTAAATGPAFSPDGQSLVFWADSSLKKIAVAGGIPLTICPLSAAPTSVAWDDDGILFSQAGTAAIMRVSADGGTPEVLVTLNNAGEEAYDPQLLPGGGTLLFTILKRDRTRPFLERGNAAQVVMQSLETDERTTLIEGGSDARYVPTGHIVYATGGTLFAVPFDLPSLKVTAGPVPVVEGVRRGAFGSGGTAHFSLSDSGSLVYVPGPASALQQDLVLFDRKGGEKPLKLPRANYDFPRVSPDGERIAFETSDAKGSFVSVYDLSGANAPSRLTFGGNDRYPIWSGDGQRVTFQSDREGDLAIWWQPAFGGNPERLTTPEPGMSHAPESWSKDGEVLLFSVMKDSLWSLWTFSIRDRKPMLFGDVTGSANPTNAMFSPDTNWVAYQVGQTFGSEGTTYVEPFPRTGSKFQIARGGRPLWSRDGKELFYVPSPTQLMAVIVRTEPTFTFTSPVAVYRGFGVANPGTPRTFDIMPDGQIVGVVTPGQSQGGSGPAEIHVVLNWFEELKARAPTK